MKNKRTQNEKNNTTSKRPSFGGKLLATFLALAFAILLIPAVRSEAAVNPLSGIASKSTTYNSAVLGKGCDYFTKTMTSAFKLTATSTNKKVATISVLDMSDPGASYYQQGLVVTPKKPGTTKFKLTAVANGKTYKKTITYTYKKYTNPFSTLKFGSKNMKSKLKKNYVIKVKASDFCGKKLKFKLKKGYKLTSVWAPTSENNGYVNVNLKNNSTIPSTATAVIITVLDKNKNGINFVFTANA